MPSEDRPQDQSTCLEIDLDPSTLETIDELAAEEHTSRREMLSTLLDDGMKIRSYRKRFSSKVVDIS